MPNRELINTFPLQEVVLLMSMCDMSQRGSCDASAGEKLSIEMKLCWWLLISCCVALFLTDHKLVQFCVLKVGDYCSRRFSQKSLLMCFAVTIGSTPGPSQP